MKKLENLVLENRAVKSLIGVLLCVSALNIAWAGDGKLDGINVGDISLDNASLATTIKTLFNSPETTGINHFICLSSKKAQNPVTLHCAGIPLKDLLQNIGKSAKFKFQMEKHGVLIGDSIAEDKTFAKLKPFDKIVLKHVEFEDVSIPRLFKHLAKMISSKKKGKPQASVRYISGKTKHGKGDDNNFVEGKGENAFDLGVDALGGGERTITLAADNMPLGSLISYVCRLAGLKYSVSKNIIIVKKAPK